MGVRRAVDMVLDAAMKKNGPIYTYGPLIHNPQVLEFLKEKGIRALPAEEDGPGDLSPSPGATVIIRAHGISPEAREKIRATGAQILNATCPHVGKVQGIIRRFTREGYATVIAGEKNHAEVIGLLGYAQGKGRVINSVSDIEALPYLEKVCFVAQTTQDRQRFGELAAAIQERFPGAKIFNTICDSTHRRQDGVLELARKVEAMVVVGGRTSGNTRRLAQISRGTGIPTYHVETEKELDLKDLSRYSAVGVTAGASTPNWLIVKVVEKVRGLQPAKGLVHLLEVLGRLAAISYLLLAAGAACLTYASVLLQDLPPRPSWLLIASAYVFSMHVLNRLTDKASERFNQPSRTEFYERYGKLMITAGVLSAGLVLLLAWFQGLLPFLLLLALSALGLIYNIPIVPTTLRKGKRPKLKDIPGSKTLFVALAWGVVTSLLPPLAETGKLLPGTAIAFLFSATLVFVRSTLYDFKDIQGDMMVGKETIPIVLGRKKAELLVVVLLFLLGGALIVSEPLGWGTPVAPVMLISLVYVVIYYRLYRQRNLGRGFLFEGVVDGSFIFAGLVAFVWVVFTKTA